MTKPGWAATAAAATLAVVAALAQPARIDTAFEQFFAAASPPDAAARIDAVASSGVSFDDAYRRLRAGRHYAAQPTGLIHATNVSGGTTYHYGLTVPASYDPSRRYPVRFQLHGGVSGRHSASPPPNAGGIGALGGPMDDSQIYIAPFAWDASPWWSDDQLANLLEILDTVKRTYNVDENHVVVSGVSDGGTGSYFIAMRETTPFAAFLPLNGFHVVLTNNDLQIDGQLFPNNLRNKPFFVVNGERDPLFPTATVTPYIDHFKSGGMTVDYRPQPGAGHNTRWWPEVRDDFEAFVRSHPRQPLPDTLTWETSDPVHDVHKRAHWLIIDRLGVAPGEAASLPDLNMVPGDKRLDFGARNSGSRITRVMPGSNADRLGLKAGDALVRLNDESVHIQIDIEEVFKRIAPGTKITLLVARDNAPVELAGVYEPTPVVDPPHPLFHRSMPSGRVDLTRHGNRVDLTTRGVGAVTLLLSPDQFDFGKPVQVVANGRTVFNGRVQKDLRTLLKWAAADNDRTMLFAAELHLALTL